LVALDEKADEMLRSPDSFLPGSASRELPQRLQKALPEGAEAGKTAKFLFI
jgi:hypothetical protein